MNPGHLIHTKTIEVLRRVGAEDRQIIPWTPYRGQLSLIIIINLQLCA